VEEACAVAVAGIDEAKRRNTFVFDSVNSIVLYVRVELHVISQPK
jgi:hypothetical protein